MTKRNLEHFNLSKQRGVILNVLAWNAVDRGFDPRSSQKKTTKLVFVSSRVSTHHYGES